MDTIEQLNGTYFFDGMSVNKHELLFWLILDEFRKKFSGVTDLLAVATWLAGFPVIPVRGKPGTASSAKSTRPTGGTSPLSLASRTLIRYKFKTQKKTITWRKMLNGQWAYTTSIGAYIGRWVPWIGAILTAYDVSLIAISVKHRYILITGRESRQ